MGSEMSPPDTTALSGSVPMVGLWRGDRLESLHRGHAVIVGRDGEILESFGDPGVMIYPRSSCKMIQALPLIESGAADAAGLGPRELALACASHQGSGQHAGAVGAWLETLGLSDSDLRCGAHEPFDRDERNRLIRAGTPPCQCHNNCSGKHAGFLTWTRHLRADAEYTEADHPLQLAVREAFEHVTGAPSPGYGIDGCSAPNFATTLAGLGRAMAFFANARPDGDGRSRAAARLVQAMMAHPVMVAGEHRACTRLMRALPGLAAVKTGAEGVFVAIQPGSGLGLAVKIEDGHSRASEAMIAALLIRTGVLDAGSAVAQRYIRAPQKNWRGFPTGELRLSAGIL